MPILYTVVILLPIKEHGYTMMHFLFQVMILLTVKRITHNTGRNIFIKKNFGTKVLPQLDLHVQCEINKVRWLMILCQTKYISFHTHVITLG